MDCCFDTHASLFLEKELVIFVRYIPYALLMEVHTLQLSDVSCNLSIQRVQWKLIQLKWLSTTHTDLFVRNLILIGRQYNLLTATALANNYSSLF